jgi:hypothetical protein
MDASYLARLFAYLERHCRVTPGLSDVEVNIVEERYRIQFPPDLRSLLQYGVPVSCDFPDWRTESIGTITARLNWPREGVLFDVENNNFWFAEWGERPVDTQEALSVARSALQHSPILIPVRSHRYLPADPLLEGNPVFSVYQTDVIYYGFDLMSYFQLEFGVVATSEVRHEARHIRFWSQLAESAGHGYWWTLPNQV